MDLFDTLLNAKNYEGAARIMEKELFFENSTRSSKNYLKLARCHLELNDFSSFYAAAQKAINLSKRTSLSDSTNLLIAHYLILNKNYFKAQQHLFLINNDPSNGITNNQIEYYLGFTYYALGNFEQAGNYFENLAKTEEELKELKLLLKKSERKLNPKRIKRAKNMSHIIPGSGQLYAGDLKNSLNSFLIVGGFALVYLNTIINYGSIQALIGVSPWFLRYYMGGTKNAVKSIEERQDFIRNKYMNRIHEIVNQ